MHIFYYLSRKLLFDEMGQESPRKHDEICFEGVHYKVIRVVRYPNMCPPDYVNVYLMMNETEVDTM